MMSVLASLVLLVILKDCSGHAIEGCSSDSPVDVDPAPLFFKCVDLTPDQHVSWHLLKRDGSNNDEISLLNVAVCLRGEFCSSLLTGAAAERSDDGSSVLKIFSHSVLESLSITCRAFDNINTYSTTFMTDYTCNLAIRNNPTLGCGIEPNQDQTMYTAGCQVENIYILSRHYTCQFIKLAEDGTEEEFGNSTFMLVEGPVPVTGICSIQFPSTEYSSLIVRLHPNEVQDIADLRV
ncbi:uncharacterized protein LOC112568527 [Pomacea canaliculata]|uniref:uncharacterized protein LOC112568527 n=1 Tax=Pomacea canaliculata TaxID=400727 RepID=UPI000D728FAC|nr:uncharacterized protein LOC112568527 [Pomacea canaliculata]